MRITSLTMLVGVLAIAGTPFFSGWYSKDQILSSALGYGLAHKQHLFLFIAPLVVAAMTGFYMFRLWFLAFTGTPRDHASEHAHESPLVMTLPLIFLAVCSVGIAWGWPVWDAEASYLGKLLHEAQPKAAGVGFLAARFQAEEHHLLAGGLALAAAVLGVSLAAAMYWRPKIDPAKVQSAAGPVYPLLANKWYFDAIYDTLIVRPTVWVARLFGAFDKRPTEGKEAAARRFDLVTLDGLLNAVGQAAESAGGAARQVQTGRVRGYVLALGLTAVVLLGILTYLSN
jgi:NADH-quinone oxidoreductase subunit L